MVISDHTLEDAIFQEIDRVCGTDDNNFTILAKIARYNGALDRFMSIAISNDGTWQFDDLNKGDLPIGTADLKDGQQDYEFADEILTVEKVLVKDSGGIWIEITPANMRNRNAESRRRNYNGNNIVGDPIWTLPSDNVGVPTRYQKFAHSLLLDPIPNYDSTKGLKVVFKRNAVKIVETDLDPSDDLSTECGVPSIFHPYIARMASLPYLVEKNLPQRRDIAAIIQRDEELIVKHFAKRVGDEKNVLKGRMRGFR